MGDCPRVVSFTIEYMTPTRYSRTPLIVRSRVVDNKLVQDVLVGDQLQARLKLDFAGTTDLFRTPHCTASCVEMDARPSDLDQDGRPRTGAWLEYFQEFRMALFSTAEGRRVIGPVVIASTTVDIAEDSAISAGILKLAGRVSRIGHSSAAVESWAMADGRWCAFARTVIVGFDRVSQRSRPWTTAERMFLDGLHGA